MTARGPLSEEAMVDLLHEHRVHCPPVLVLHPDVLLDAEEILAADPLIAHYVVRRNKFIPREFMYIFRDPEPRVFSHWDGEVAQL